MNIIERIVLMCNLFNYQSLKIIIQQLSDNSILDSTEKYTYLPVIGLLLKFSLSIERLHNYSRAHNDFEKIPQHCHNGYCMCFIMQDLTILKKI